MPPKPESILLVEGSEDREVIYHLCNHHNFDNRQFFTVEAKDGYESLRDDLKVRPRTFGLKTIGAVVDADEDISQRWQSLRDTLTAVGYPNIPEIPDAAGVLLPSYDTLPRMGIWLMPDNQIAGILEDFLQQLIKQGDALLPWAQQTVDQIPERRFKPTYRTKAVIHTWLSWQEEPGTPLGQSVTKHYLDANHATARRFITWMKNLFVPGHT